MRKTTLFLFSLSVFFFVGFSLARFEPKVTELLKSHNPFGKSDIHFKPTPYPLQNHPFVVVIACRNNGGGVDKTLRSVLSQNYDNYRVVYIDDGSDDGSFDHAHDLIFDSGQAHRVQLMQTKDPQGSIANLYQTIKTCEDHEIVVLVGGEDLLSHEWVLQRLNQYYANPDLWMTVGKSMHYPSFEPGEEPQLEGIREIASNKLHLKTFYASLFKKIDETDLLFQDKFMPDSVDSAYMIPLLEMAKGHTQALSDVMYLVTTPTREAGELHALCEASIRDKSPYIALTDKAEGAHRCVR